MLTIGQLAERAGVGVETVRFYEREGLLEEPDRRPSGYRQFGEDVVRRLRFIKSAKELGFTLKEIKELLALRVTPDVCRKNVRERVDEKISDVENKIATLRKMKKALAQLSTACYESESTSECPILEALDGKK